MRRAAPLTAVVALALALSPAGGGVEPARAAPAGDDASAADEAAGGGETRLGLIDQTAWVEPEGRFTIEVRPGFTPSDEATVTARLHEAVADRSLLGAAPGATVAEVTLPALLARQPDGRLTLVLDTAPQGAFALATPGVYPLTVEVAEPGGVTRSLVTHLVRLPDEPADPPLEVALLVPIGAPPALRPTGTVRVGGRDLDRVVERIGPLAALPDVPLTVLPVPETMESLATTRVGGDLVDDLATTLAPGPGAGGGARQVLASTYVEVDPGNWEASGLSDALDRQRVAGEEAARAALGVQPDTGTVVLDRRPTPTLLAELEAEGVTRVVLPERALATSTGATGPPTTPFTVSTGTGSMTAFAVDGTLAAHKGSTGDPRLDAQHVIADLALLAASADAGPAAAGEGGRRGVVLALPERGVIPQRFTEPILAALADGPVRPVTLGRLFDAAAGPSGSSADAPTLRLTTRPPEPLRAYPDNLALTELTLSGFTSLAGVTNPMVDDLERRTLVSGSNRLRVPERGAYLRAVTRTINQQTGLIGAPPTQTVTLTSRDGDIPLGLTNDTGYPARVRVRFDSDRLEFPEGDTIDLTLEEGQTSVEVPVRARTTGSFPLDVEITSPDGVLVVAASRTTVRSTAVSGVGLALSIGAGLVLAGWWIRHLVRDRRARGEAGADREADGA